LYNADSKSDSETAMRSAAKRRPDLGEASGVAAQRSMSKQSVPKPRLETVGPAKGIAARGAAKPKPKLFHASVQVTRVEEWFVEAETAEEARRLLESGHGQRSQIGECLYFSIDKLSD
jgi:hypothetical protein